jgi:hypothetical protein
LVELTVVLFFLVDILGLILEPNTNGGRQLLWGKPQPSHTNNKRRQKLLNQNQNAEQRRDKGFLLHSRFLKSRSPFTSAGLSPFIGRRADFLHSENTLV